MNVLIGVPVFDYKDKFVRTFMDFWTELVRTSKPYQVGYTFVYRHQLDVAENRIASEAIKNGYTHVMLIEDDVYGYSKVHLDKLLMDNLDIVVGAMYGSEFPYDLLALRKFDKSWKYADPNRDRSGKHMYELPEPKGVQEVDLTHLGFSLIKTDVFKKLELPYFDMTFDYNSDGYFYEKCKDAGFKVHVDCDVVLDHRGITPKNVELYKQIAIVDEKWKGLYPDQVVIHKTEEESKKYQEEMQKKIKGAEDARNSNTG